MSMETRVTTNSGATLNRKEEPGYNNLQADRKRQLKSDNDERWKEYRNLTTNEWSSKINSSRRSRWPNENVLDGHWDEHRYDFENYANGIILNSREEYEAYSRKLIEDFNRCFIYKHKGSDRIMFMNSKTNCITIVDSVSNNIVSCYPLKPGVKDEYKNIYMELMHGKE